MSIFAIYILRNSQLTTRTVRRDTDKYNKETSKPTKVADIATFVNGDLHAIFEIYHTHRIEQKKLNALSEKWPHIKIYEICADAILNLIEKPNTIIDLCERMQGNKRSNRSKKPRNATRTYMLEDPYEQCTTAKYDNLK